MFRWLGVNLLPETEEFAIDVFQANAQMLDGVRGL
jgi:hypothetical protein